MTSPHGAATEHRTARRIGRVGLAAGPIGFALLEVLQPPGGMSPEALSVAAVTFWTAIWWITEAVPLPVASLVPLVALPAVGARTAAEAASGLGNPLILLFLGGFMMAIALEESGLHRRISTAIVGRVGTSPRRLILAFMAATAVLSMWISNTAATMLMVPTALAVVAGRDDTDKHPSFATALLLSIPYAATIGGITTLIGSPPNIVFAGVARSIGIEIDFVHWTMYALPPATFALLGVWLYLTRVALPVGNEVDRSPKPPMEHLSFTTAERGVTIVGTIVVVSWLTRPFLITPVMPLVEDSTIALAGAIAMFLIPGRAGNRLLDWAAMQRLPWGMVLLFGAGLSIADAFSATGLAEWIGGQVGGLSALPPILVVTAVVAIAVLLSEISSNTATTVVLLPILVGVAAALDIEVLLLLIPATVAASCGFMLPVSTPPNTIVYATGLVRIGTMARVGGALDLASIALIGPLTYLMLPLTGLV